MKTSFTKKSIFYFAAILVIGFIFGYMFREVNIPQNLNLFPKACEYNGKTYKHAVSFPSSDGCNSCSCSNGEVACTLMACAQ